MTVTTDAMTADIQAAKTSTPAYPPVTFRGVEYAITRKPSTLLLSELARTTSGDPEALAVFAEFFESTLGKETYRAFKRHVFNAEEEVGQDELFEVLQAIMENSLARPTE